MIKLIKKIVTNVVAAVKDVYAKAAETATTVTRNVMLVPRAVSTAFTVATDTVSLELNSYAPKNIATRVLRDAAVVAVWVANVVLQMSLVCAMVVAIQTAVDILLASLVQNTTVVSYAIAGGPLCVLSLFAVYVAIKVSTLLFAVRFSVRNTDCIASNVVSCRNASQVITNFMTWMDNKSINLGRFVSKLFDRVCDAVIDAAFSVGMRVVMFVLNRAARRQGVSLV